jgi:hypothetical protein
MEPRPGWDAWDTKSGPNGATSHSRHHTRPRVPITHFFGEGFCVFRNAGSVGATDGKEYKNAKVNRVEPDGIVITHSFGILKIPFTELPKDVQERFHYDAAKIEGGSAGAIEEQSAAERERAEKEKNAAANFAKSGEQFDAAEKQAAENYEK